MSVGGSTCGTTCGAQQPLFKKADCQGTDRAAALNSIMQLGGDCRLRVCWQMTSGGCEVFTPLPAPGWNAAVLPHNALLTVFLTWPVPQHPLPFPAHGAISILPGLHLNSPFETRPCCLPLVCSAPCTPLPERLGCSRNLTLPATASFQDGTSGRHSLCSRPCGVPSHAVSGLVCAMVTDIQD